MANKNEQVIVNGNELVMSRTLNAPRELVYKVWTDPAHVALWWGPNGFKNTIHSMDVRPGGVWRYMMHGPDGTDYPNRITYSEVVAQEKLVYVHSDDSDIDPNQFHVVVTFEAEGNKTKVTMRSTFASAEILQTLAKDFGVLEGGSQTLQRLEAYVMSNGEEGVFALTRTFNASRELVFKAWTGAEHLAKWWGPKEAEVIVEKLDFKPGGIFHYSMSFPGQGKMWGRFVYREIIAPEKIVFVSSFSDDNGDAIGNPWMDTWPLEILNVVTLTEHDGKTTLTLKGGPINASEAEVAAYNSIRESMQGGFKGTFDKLDDYLEFLGN